MKRKLNLFLALFTIIILITTAVFATETAKPEETAPAETTTPQENTTPAETSGETTETGNIIESDRFFAGDDIAITELIDGNVYVIGKKVTVSGKIAGDLFIIAENFTMDAGAEIYGNIFGIASEIDINGAMYDTYLTCDKFNLGYDGFVQRDLRVFATETKLDGRVVRNSYVETDKLTLDTGFLTGGDLVYTAQSDATYIEKVDDENTNETTTIPKTVVPGEVKYTKRDKKIFKKEIKKSVESIIKSNDIKNDMSEEQIKTVIISHIFSNAKINTTSEYAKGASKTVVIPKVYIYIVAIVIIALVVALILPKVLGNKNNTSKENDEIKNK